MYYMMLNISANDIARKLDPDRHVLLCWRGNMSMRKLRMAQKGKRKRQLKEKAAKGRCFIQFFPTKFQQNNVDKPITHNSASAFQSFFPFEF